MAWGLVLMGIVFGIFLVMIGAPAPMLIAVGMYLPFETTGAIFAGGAFKWLADRIARRDAMAPAAAEDYEQRGTLLASGFIAGEALLAILLSLAFIASEQGFGFPEFSFTRWWTGQPSLALYELWGGWLSLAVFAAVGFALVRGPLRRRPAS
jgi:hypothetical protein